MRFPKRETCKTSISDRPARRSGRSVGRPLGGVDGGGRYSLHAGGMCMRLWSLARGRTAVSRGRLKVVAALQFRGLLTPVMDPDRMLDKRTGSDPGWTAEAVASQAAGAVGSRGFSSRRQGVPIAGGSSSSLLAQTLEWSRYLLQTSG